MCRPNFGFLVCNIHRERMPQMLALRPVFGLVSDARLVGAENRWLDGDRNRPCSAPVPALTTGGDLGVEPDLLFENRSFDKPWTHSRMSGWELHEALSQVKQLRVST